jgi:hypothetical protein
LQLDETDERQFRHGATGYGVELYGGTAEARTAALREHFDEPLTTVDCREADDSDDVIDTALRKLGVDEDRIDRLAMGVHDLRKAINETEHHFAILESDALDFKEQRDVARTMKAVAEGLDHDDIDIMLGFTSSMGGSVTSAEPDLSMRVRSWQVGPENNQYGPLSDFGVGDEIETSARETPMEVVSIGTTPAGNKKLTARNHHGRYRLQEHNDGTVSMETGRDMIRDVEVRHAA